MSKLRAKEKTMTHKEIEKYRRRLVEILNRSDSETEKRRALQDLAREVGANVYMADAEMSVRISMLTDNINDALQTATMIDACKTASKNYKIAFVVTMIALVSMFIALLSMLGTWVVVFRK